MLVSLESVVVYSVATLFISILMLIAKWASTTTQRDQPPSPRGLPIIGNLHQLGHFPHLALHSLAKKYGHLMLLHLGSKPVLVVTSAEAAREIYKHDLCFSGRPKPSIAHRFLYGKDIVYVPYGDYWRKVRGIAVLELLSNRKVQSFRRVREEETALMMETIRASGSSPLDLSQLIISLTNDVVCRIALGRKYSRKEGAKKFKETMAEFLHLMGVFNVADFIPWLGWVNRFNGLNRRVERLAKELDQIFETVVEEHMNRQKNRVDEEEDKQNFVDVLLSIQKDDTTLEMDSIKALILDMFLGGTDTVYISIEWTMSDLIKYPKVMKKLQNEVRGLTMGQRDVSEDDLDKLYYLKAVIKESMRLHPLGPLLIPRECTQDVKVMNYKIASGTQLFVNAWAIHRDPMLWEEPEEFRPERFLNSSIDVTGHDFQFLPFGSGRRICPGIRFAMSLYELAVANLVHKFDFSLPGGVRGEDIDTTEILDLALHRKYPLQVIATPYFS